MKYFFLAIILALFSCDGLNLVGKSYNEQILYVNNTNHRIVVTSYSSLVYKGVKDNFVIESNSEIVPFKYYEYNRKKSKASFKYLGFVNFLNDGNYVDSVVVVFDDQFKIKHNSARELNEKGKMEYFNVRNLTNGINYTITKFKETKHSFARHYSYTFTEQDYLDARKQ